MGGTIVLGVGTNDAAKAVLCWWTSGLLLVVSQILIENGCPLGNRMMLFWVCPRVRPNWTLTATL